MHEVVATPDGGPELRLPAVGLGTWQLRGRECRQAVSHALAVGYRHLDPARMYGNETAVGQGLADGELERDEVTVVTKVQPGDADRAGVRREVAASLDELGLERVDLLLLHWPSQVPLEETMEAFREQQEAGRATHLGVSNFSVDQLEHARSLAPIACVQNKYHPGASQDDVLAWCRQHRVAFVAYSPLEVSGGAREALADVGAAHDASWAQVAVRWLIQQEQVAAIPRSRDAAHREQNLEVEGFRLSDDEMARIDRL